MKKSLLLVTVTVLFALVLAACSGGTAIPTTAPSLSGTSTPAVPGTGTMPPLGTGTPVPPASGPSP